MYLFIQQVFVIFDLHPISTWIKYTAMKNLTLALLFWGISTSIMAQSLQVLNATATVNGDYNASLSAHMDLKNTGSNTKYVKAERITSTMASGHANYFCWDQCYSPNVSISSGTDTIAAGATSTKFILYLMANNNTGTSTCTYKFYDTNNPTDTAVQTFTFNVTTPTSADRLLSPNTHEISAAYPNPSQTITKIDYELGSAAREALIKVYSFLGNEIRKIELPNRQGTLIIDTDELGDGMYLYSLVVNNKTVSTRKFVVRH